MKDIIDEQVKNYMNEVEAECGTKDERLYTILTRLS